MNRMSTSGREKQAERDRARNSVKKTVEVVNETKLKVYTSLTAPDDIGLVTHTDYMALEEELAALRGKVGRLVEADRLVGVTEQTGHSFEEHTEACARYRAAVAELT